MERRYGDVPRGIKFPISEVQMTTTYSSLKIARELTKQFGMLGKPIKVEMKFTREIGQFIKKVESAQQAAAKSKLVFK